MTTPTPRWTAETVDLVARALDDAGFLIYGQGRPDEADDATPDAVKVVLTALADAGVLTAVGGETRQEWCVQSGRVDYPCSDEVRARHQQGQLFLLGHPATRQTRTITTYPDGTVITSPWREVTNGD